MSLKHTLSALCMTAALSTFATGYAVAADTIAVALTINNESSEENLTVEQVRELLKSMGLDQGKIDQAVEAGLKDGKLMIELTEKTTK